MVDWPRVPLGEVFDVQLGKMLGAGSDHGDQFQYLANRNVQWGRIVIDQLGTMNFSAAERQRYRLRSGDLLVCEGGEVGRAALWSEELPECYFQNALHRLRATGRADPRFMRYYFEFAAMAGSFRALTGQTSIGHLTRANLVRWNVRLPPSEEQRRIADILDIMDETVQATERVIRKLEQIREGLLLDLLDMYFPGDGPLAVRATHSRVDCVVLSALLDSGEIELGRGKVISSADIADDPGPYPIYSSSASSTGEFGRYGKFMFDEELITWSVDGGGRPFYRPRHRFSVTNVGGYLRIRARQHWSYQYVHALMEVQHAYLAFDWLAKAHPSVIRDLYWFPRIPLSEQRHITEGLAANENSVRQLKDETEKLKWLRSGLAADLLSGRVRTVLA